VNYTPDQLKKATDAVKCGQMSIRKASKTFSVPFGRIFNRCHGLLFTSLKIIGKEFPDLL